MKCKSRDLLWCAFISAVLALATGSMKKVTVLPPAASPGQTVYIRHESANFKDPKSIEVKFAGRRSAVVRVVDSSTIVVLVPSAEPGTMEVTVRDGKFLGTGSLQVRPAGKRRLFFTMENGEIRLEGVLPRSGSYSKPPKQGRRLSFDLLDDRGRLVYSGAIEYPRATSAEVFHGPKMGDIRRVPMPGPVSFAVEIPFIEGASTIQLFDAREGLDLTNPRDRADRVPLGKFEVTQ